MARMAQDQSNPIVAKSATTSASLSSRGIVLLGVFGKESAPGALLRVPGGRIEKVGVGSRVGSHRVVAIDDSRVALSQGGRAEWLTLPGSR